MSVGVCVCVGGLGGGWGAGVRNKMAFRNFENVFCFDVVQNDFSQEIEKSSTWDVFEKIPQSTGFDPEMEMNFFGGNFTRGEKVR